MSSVLHVAKVNKVEWGYASPLDLDFFDWLLEIAKEDQENNEEWRDSFTITSELSKIRTDLVDYEDFEMTSDALDYLIDFAESHMTEKQEEFMKSTWDFDKDDLLRYLKNYRNNGEANGGYYRFSFF